MTTTSEMVQELRSRGGKLTPQRLEIFRLLEGDRSHPTAEGIYERLRVTMPTVSLTTVYKTLNDLAAQGSVKRFEIDGVSHYDPDTRPHGEAVCLGCGRIVDVPASRLPLESELEGFEIVSSVFILHGYCRDCRKIMSLPRAVGSGDSSHG